MEEVIENVKACLRTSKEGIPENRIMQDYMDIMGEPIPYKELKFGSLQEFLQVIPGVKRYLKGNNYYVQVSSSEKTAHISKLLRGQKPAKKSKRDVTSRYESNQNIQNPTRSNINIQFVGKTPEDELRALAADLKLTSPEYKTVLAKKGSIYAQVLVGNEKYSSYPKDAKTPRAAQLIAVAKALDDLKKKNQSVMLNVTTDENLMVERMLKIIDEHTYGIFSSQFTMYYQQEFKESLPDDWLRIVNDCPEINVETGVGNTSILTRYTPLQGKALEADLKVFEWPDDPFMIIHVSEVLSTTEIWGQLVGDDYCEKQDKLGEKMKKFYARKSSSTKAQTIVPNSYYTICLEDKWFRVKCQEYDPETEKATIFFIDNGKSNTCHAKLLHILDKQFYALPAQAVRISLYDLEEFSECKEALLIVQDFLLDKDLLIKQHSSDSEVIFPKPVNFYDAQGPDLIDLNRAMSIEIIKSCMTEPQLKPERRITEVCVTYISENGEVYVRLLNDHLKYLEIRIKSLVEETLNENLSEFAPKCVDLMQLYLVKCHEDGKWYRAGIINLSRRTNEVDVFLIDFGKNMTVKINELIDLERVSSILAYIPAQAIKVELHNVLASSFDVEKVARLKEIAPVQQNLLVRVVRRPFNGSLPIVEVFKRKQPSNEIVSINNTLIFDSELRTENNNNGINKRSERLNKQLKRK